VERDPVEAILEALRGYARVKGPGVLAIVKAGGQERVKIRFQALYKYHDESTGYTLLEEALAELGEEGVERLESMGIRLVNIGRNLYLEVPVSLLESMVKGKGRGRPS